MSQRNCWPAISVLLVLIAIGILAEIYSRTGAGWTITASNHGIAHVVPPSNSPTPVPSVEPVDPGKKLRSKLAALEERDRKLWKQYENQSSEYAEVLGIDSPELRAMCQRKTIIRISEKRYELDLSVRYVGGQIGQNNVGELYYFYITSYGLKRFGHSVLGCDVLYLPQRDGSHLTIKVPNDALHQSILDHLRHGEYTVK